MHFREGVRNAVARRSIGQGIYQDAHGITVIARVGYKENLQSSPPVRFPLVDADGIPYSRRHNRELVECYLRLRAALLDARRVSGGTGSIGVAIDRFLEDHPVVKHDPSPRNRDYKYLLAHWRTSAIAALQVTAPVPTVRAAIAKELETWTRAGAAPTTVNRRKQALADVFRPLIPADADGVQILPTDHIPDVPPRRYAPRGIDLAIIARILSALPDRGQGIKGQTRSTVSATKIRLRVMAWTGLALASLIRLKRNQVDIAGARMYFPPRKKAKGSAGVWVDLLPPALEALRDFDAAGLWNRPCSKSSMYKSWRRAVENTRAALVAAAELEASETPGVTTARAMLEQFDIAVRVTVAPDGTVHADCKPYDLRHSFGTDVYHKTGDIYATKAIMQHADIKTTERYIEAAVPARVATAIDKMRAAWFPEAPKPGATVRDFRVVAKKSGD